MSLFKVRVVVYLRPDGKRCPKSEAVTTDAEGNDVLLRGYKRRRTKSKKWYGQYTDANGELRRVPLSENKTAAQQILNALMRKTELAKAGISDPFEDHRKRVLLCPVCRGKGRTEDGRKCDCQARPHLTDFRRYLVAKGNTEKHARQTCTRAAAILTGCKATFLADLSPSAVVA